MPFVNEYISEADIEKYNIESINRKFVVGGTHARDWTIDRDRNIYLRNVANGREEFACQTTWTFYWGEELIVLDLDLIEGGGSPSQPGWSRWRLRKIEMPESLKLHQQEIINDLKDALLAYKDGGVFSVNTTYQVMLDI